MAPLINQSCFLLLKLCYKKPSKCNPKLTIWVECLTTEAKAATTLIPLKAITLPHRIMGATVGMEGMVVEVTTAEATAGVIMVDTEAMAEAMGVDIITTVKF